MNFPVGLIAYARGLATMAALIVAIGAQNAFLLRQGLKHQSVFIVATICFFGDVFFVVLGTAGVGALVAGSAVLSAIMAFGGAAFLAVYGVRSLLAAKRAKGLDPDSGAKASRATAVLTAFAVTFLNPHVLIDTVVIVGGMATRYEGASRILYAAGVLTVSAIWFYGLGYGARVLAPVLTKPKVWQIIDLVIGILMLSLAVGLARDGVALI